MKLFKFLSLFLFIVIFQEAIDAQEWTSHQSQQKINDLIDVQGELLLATDAGLVVVDKSTLEIEIFNRANSSLANNHIQTITSAPNGSAWIGTYDVILARFDGNDFQDVTVPEHEAFDQHTELYDFEIAPNGDFWLGTSDGIFHKSGSSWSHYDEDELGDLFFEAWDIEINTAGEVLVASNAIFKYANGEWSNFSLDVDLFGYLDAELFYSSSGDLYVAGDLEHIGRFDGQQWEEMDNGGLNGSEIKGFAEDLDGDIYFNTINDGVFKLEGEAWVQQQDEQTVAANDKISYFYIDNDGNRWLNNNIHLSVNRNGAIESTLISQHTLETNNISDIHKGSDGRMYFLNTTNSISMVDVEGNWGVLPLPTTFASFENVNDLLFIATDNIWVATNLGIHHYDGNEWMFNEREACRSFAVNAQGKIYVLASDRIYIIDGGTTTEYNAANSPISSLILSGHGVDTEGNLWIASFTWEGDNAIQKVSPDGSWITYDGNDHPAIARPVGDFHFDNDGNVWIPAGSIGAIKFDGTTFTNPFLDSPGSVENRDVYSIKSDAIGKLYFSHQYGVTTLLDNEWESLSIEEIPNIATSQGSTIEFDDNGNLWWGSIRHGVFSYFTDSATNTRSGAEQAIAFTAYPNPAQHYSTLEFTTREQAEVNIAIYNKLGQLMEFFNLGHLPAGSQRQTVELKGMPSGLYSVQLQVNGQLSSQMIIVQ